MARTRSGNAQRVDPNLAATRRRSRSVIPTLADPITDYPTADKVPKTALFADGSRHQYRVEMMAILFKFVCERHAIQQRRLAGLSPPWTRDEWLQNYPFTNVFRVLDRNSQYILLRVIGESPDNIQDAVFRVLLFRMFNKIETWELLEDQLGKITFGGFDIGSYCRILESAGVALYNAAYIIPAPKLGYISNYENHLRLIEAMMNDGDLTGDLRQCKHIRDAHVRLLRWPSMGNFTAMQ